MDMLRLESARAGRSIALAAGCGIIGFTATPVNVGAPRPPSLLLSWSAGKHAALPIYLDGFRKNDGSVSAVAYHPQDEEPKPPVALGAQAPEIIVKKLGGASTKLAELRGRVVLIDFWATWCQPCRKGLPNTQALFNTYGKKGLAVLTITDEPASMAAPFLKSNKLTLPAYLDQDGATNKAYNIEVIPTMAIVDRRGRLAAFLIGVKTRSVILAALKKAGLAIK